MKTEPTVSIVIPNWNGAEHLPDCLGSLARLDYPSDQVETIVVDNGSTDASRSLIAANFPEVRMVELDHNAGFAAACNEGARASRSKYVAFLNNDMRVEPDWLRALVDTLDPAAGYVCTAGVILDWEGKRLGFAGGWVTFEGQAGQEHMLEPLREELIEDGRELPFACGGSMLVDRSVFVDLGGFDPEFFALYEDVDFGWRLWLSGYRVRLAGGSRCLHRHHATGESIPLFKRMLLAERNALRTLIKNVGDDQLPSLLAPALFLLVKRATAAAGTSREAFELESADVAEAETVSRMGLARLHAANDALAALPELLERRREVQSRRKRNDAEIFALFGRPFAPLSHEESYVEASVNLRAAFGLDRIFSRQRATRVLVITAGDSPRLEAVARDAALFSDVSFVAPGKKSDVIEELLAESDLVIVDAATVHGGTVAEQTAGLLVVDLGEGKASVDPRLVRRGDVFLASADGVRPTADNGDRRDVIVLGPDGTGMSQVRALLREPWAWRAGKEEHVAVPEDLQQLLRGWRERYHREDRTLRGARAIRRILPSDVDRLLRRLLRRADLRAP
jgi:GT2 family glycosyltransferase